MAARYMARRHAASVAGDSWRGISGAVNGISSRRHFLRRREAGAWAVAGAESGSVTAWAVFRLFWVG